MRAIDAIRRPPQTIQADRTVTDAAVLMDRLAVGALVVVDRDRPVGIVTDRDLVVRGMSRRCAPNARIDSVMSTDVVTMDAHADLRDATGVFASHAFRRLPLLDGDLLVGMLTVDDLIVNATADLAELTRPVTGQVIFAHPEASLPVSTEERTAIPA
jgi:CBS domain-containing protein